MVLRPAVLYHIVVYTECDPSNELQIDERDSWKITALPTEAYEIDDIAAYLKQALVVNEITLRTNNTLKCDWLLSKNHRLWALTTQHRA